MPTMTGWLALAVLQTGGAPVYTLGGPPQRPSGAWRVEATPFLLINETLAGSAGEFSVVRGVLRLASGRIVVANSGSSELRFFSPDGAFVTSAGRKGAGPGEFNQLFALFLAPGDSVIGYDVAQGFHVFSADGRYRRTITYGRQTSTPLRAWPYGWFEDGSQLAGLFPPSATPRTGRWVDSMEFLRVDASGERTTSLFRTPAFERASAPGGRRGVVIFGPMPGVAVWPGRYCMGSSAAYAFRCGDLEGRVWFLRRAPTARVPVPAGAVARYKSAEVAMPLENGMPPPRRLVEQREAYLRAATFAEYQPPFGEVLAAEGGDLWVQRFDIEALIRASAGLARGPFLQLPSTWDVFGAQGGWKAAVRLPPRFRLHQVGTDFVLGVLLDEDDVEQVAMYRLIRTPAAKR